MTMITPSYLGETIEYSSLHACRSTLEDPTPFPTWRSGGLPGHRLGILCASPASAEPRSCPARDSDTRRRSSSLNVSPTDFINPVVRAV